MARCLETKKEGNENPANKIFPAEEIRSGLKNNVREVTELNQSVLCLQDCWREMRCWMRVILIFKRGNGRHHVSTKALNYLMIWKNYSIGMFSLKLSTAKFLPISQRSVSYYYLVIHNCRNSLDTFCPCATIEKVAYHKYLRVVIDNCVRRSEHVALLKYKICKYVFKQLSEVLVHR